MGMVSVELLTGFSHALDPQLPVEVEAEEVVDAVESLVVSVLLPVLVGGVRSTS